jgi:hypothetical protein
VVVLPGNAEVYRHDGLRHAQAHGGGREVTLWEGDTPLLWQGSGECLPLPAAGRHAGRGEAPLGVGFDAAGSGGGASVPP